MTEDEGKKNVQDTASADGKRDMFMQIIQMTLSHTMPRMISTTAMLEIMVSALERIRSGIAKPSHIICIIGGLFVPDKGNVTASC